MKDDTAQTAVNKTQQRIHIFHCQRTGSTGLNCVCRQSGAWLPKLSRAIKALEPTVLNIQQGYFSPIKKDLLYG